MITNKSTQDSDDISLRIKCIIQTAINKEITRTTLDLIFEDMATTHEKSKQVINILLGIILGKSESETYTFEGKVVEEISIETADEVIDKKEEKIEAKEEKIEDEMSIPTAD